MNASTVISLVALIVAITSALATWRVTRRQADVQERLLSLESRRERDRLLTRSRAQLRGAIVQTGSTDWKLVITNEGSSQARAVSVMVNDVAVEESASLIGVDKALRILGPGAHVAYRLLVYMGSETNFHVRIEWEDDSGEPGQWSSDLAL